MKINQVVSLLLFFVFGLFFVSCSDTTKDVPLETDPEIRRVRVTPNWNLAVRVANIIEAEIYDPQGVEDIQAVTVTIKNSAGTVLLADSLFDDGAYFHPGDGDVIAGDGVFRNRFDAATDVDTVAGDYQVEINVSDRAGNTAAQPGEAMIVFGYSYPTDFRKIEMPDTLKSGSEDQFFYVTLSHENGIAAIEQVSFKLFDSGLSLLQETNLLNDGDYENSGDVAANDSVFSFRLKKTFAAGRKGDYLIGFAVRDEFGLTVHSDLKSLYLENEAGSIVQTSVPEQMQRPSTVTLTASVQDPQGLADIDSVYFYSKKPDGQLAGNGNAFLMFDDGNTMNSGDANANDGVYSLKISITAGNDPGIYEFSFYMRDRVGHLTPVSVDSVEVL